ncbi:T9SS type A sorting domain-containing protein [Aquimarina sp. M1]
MVVFPNPFQDQVTFQYTLNKADLVKLSLYDISGKPIAVIIN